MTNLFAYTAATGLGYPPYVSINRMENGDVKVTVREAPKVNADCYGHDVTEGRIVSAIIPAEEWQNAASAMSAGTAETQSGSGLQPASAVPEGQTPKHSQEHRQPPVSE